MKTGYLWLILIGMIVLAACTQVQGPADTPATDVQVQQLPTTIAPTLTTPSNPSPTDTTATDQTAGSEVEAPGQAGAASEPTLIPCPAKLTSANQEGPYYSPGSPEKTSLIEAGMPGVPIQITGRVFDQECEPVPGAKLDFWLADINGEYDNAGFTLRGHLFSDEDGNYTLQSIEPTAYTGRPPHIHVKVFAPDGRELLTTQMYFSGSEESPDVTASPDLLVEYLEPDGDGLKQARFNFVVQY
jgi:protocatechuate 3,4-dioxygenase beta subunit